MSMSERIKERRLAVGLTQEELANRLGLQKSAIAKYENGRVENIKRSVIANMAKVLECDPSYLLDFTDSIKSNSYTPIFKPLNVKEKALTFSFVDNFRRLSADNMEKANSYISKMVGIQNDEAALLSEVILPEPTTPSSILEELKVEIMNELMNDSNVVDKLIERIWNEREEKLLNIAYEDDRDMVIDRVAEIYMETGDSSLDDAIAKKCQDRSEEMDYLANAD
ncbi:helix-turn-helix transcriptional regulator [Lachnospiraceae bacterium OttesenSCG-928-J05]|nr:helix-turn-helix transcriptional regulator [Lachnospiraceae bacterium OttesenSCG-928-J05]